MARRWERAGRVERDDARDEDARERARRTTSVRNEDVEAMEGEDASAVVVDDGANGDAGASEASTSESVDEERGGTRGEEVDGGPRARTKASVERGDAVATVCAVEG